MASPSQRAGSSENDVIRYSLFLYRDWDGACQCFFKPRMMGFRVYLRCLSFKEAMGEGWVCSLSSDMEAGDVKSDDTVSAPLNILERRYSGAADTVGLMKQDFKIFQKTRFR